MTFIRKVKTASGAIAVQIARKQSGQIVQIDHIGSAHSKEELDLLITLAKQRMHKGQMSLFDTPNMEIGISLSKSYSDLLFNLLIEQYNHLGFDKLNDKDFAYLCIARIVEPTSKIDSIRVLDDLGIDGLNKDQLYRCLKRIITNNYRDEITKLCFEYANQITKKGNPGITLVLYDVTTLYFEVQKEDNYRKPGLSKERRLEPQIIVGLLVDQTGFPLELHSFEGNKAETKTILPVIKAFKRRHGTIDITVVADAGMLSQTNLESLAQAGYTYIVGSRLNKVPYGVAQYQKTKELTDNQIITTQTMIQSNRQFNRQRIIYQYRAKRAALDRRNIKKQIDKAERIVNGTTTAKRAKFLSVTTNSKQLNQVLIDKAYALVGIKGYVTNLNKPDQQIISYYHQLWHVEQSFRMSKSDLKARPIFHHKRDSIEAHLTIVLTALAICKTIENRTDMSIRKLVKTLRPIRNGVVVVNGKEYPAKAVIPPHVKSILEKLYIAGH
jgi:hypothetical protein